MPGFVQRVISRQAGRPSGVLGHLIGRIMVKDTLAPNEAGLAVLDPQRGETVLEIGFGQGRTIGELAGRGARVVGVEVSETMRRQASFVHRKRIEEERIELHVGDGVHLPVPAASVDAVFGVHTIYFWPEPASTFDEITRVLVPGGRVVLVFRDGAVDQPERLDRDVYTFHTVADVDRMGLDAGLVEVTQHPSDEAHTVVWSARKEQADE